MNRSVTVIIPVYNSFAVALDCVRSVLANLPNKASVLIIDDASSEGNFVQLVPADILADKRVRVLRNVTNLGFVGTCNQGDAHRVIR